MYFLCLPESHGIDCYILEELRKEALVAAGNLTDALVDHLNVGYYLLF